MGLRVRFGLYCPGCLPGLHLPLFAAQEEDLYAARGLDVDYLHPPGGPENVRRTAEGGADFCITNVHHYLAARGGDGGLAARFIAVIVHRSQLSAVILADSPVSVVGDLDGHRVGLDPTTAYGQEFLYSLDARGVRPVVVEMGQAAAREELRSGMIDAYVGYVDTLPGSRRLVGVPVRAVPVGCDVYAAGLLAGDHVDYDVAVGLRQAIVATYERQRGAPERGLAAMLRRYPGTVAEKATEGWSLVEPLVFSRPVGEMRAELWDRTVEFMVAAHRFDPPSATADLYRAEFITPPAARSAGDDTGVTSEVTTLVTVTGGRVEADP